MHKDVIFGTLKQIFYLLPDIVAILVACMAFAALFMTETLKRVEANRTRRRIIVTGCLVFGILAFFSSQAQKAVEKRDSEQAKHKAEEYQGELRGQISSLIHSATTQATKEDLTIAATSITLTVQNLANAMKGTVPKERHPTIPTKENPQAPQQIRTTQRRVPSTDSSNPYALQVIVQSDVSVSPVAFKFTFSAPINKITFFMAGQGYTMMSQSYVDPQNPTVGIVRVGYPALGPDTPMVVTVLSTGDVKLISLEKF